MGNMIFNPLISFFKNQNNEVNPKKEFIGKSSIDNNKNFLNKKTNREKFNQEKELEDIYNLVLENNHLIKKLVKDINSLKNNSINDEYSYKVISPDLRGIVSYPPKKVKQLKFFLLMKNDGNKNWPEDSCKLIIDKNSTGFKTNTEVILLGFLRSGKEKEFEIDVDIIGRLEVKKYQLVLDFYVGDKKYGNKIYINFQVREDKKGDFRAK